jgi:hypothetical protein
MKVCWNSQLSCGTYTEPNFFQLPDSVYRDAVTKLRILLEATEAASNAAAEAEFEAGDERPAIQRPHQVPNPRPLHLRTATALALQ